MSTDGLKTVSMRASDGNTVHLEYHESLRSTSELAKKYALSGYPDRYAVITEELTNGEDGKTAQHGIYLSLILRPSFFPSQARHLAPLAAVSLVSALEEQTEASVGIGWVSSIYCEGERIGGAAIEGKLDSFMAYEYIIVSFAAKIDPQTFPPRLTDLVKRVFEEDNSSLGSIIAKNIINNFFKFYINIKSTAKFMDIYRKKSVLIGEKVVYLSGGKRKRCTAVGIDAETGALLIEAKDGNIISVSSPTGIILPKTVKKQKSK
ncbi:MAG: hypothetical protein IJY65_01495 [Clostridia bacterium]|nr:hypothetical protein [Clostridia bacterium]